MNKNNQAYYVRQKSESTYNNSVEYFYVYVHRRLTDNLPFYVGKGCGSRAWNFNNRNQFWQNTANKHGVVVDIVFEALQEEEALQCEIDTILEYQYIGYPICNLSTGGESPTFSEDVRKRMSDSHKGKKLTQESRDKVANFHRGLKRSNETCKRISESLLGKKKSPDQARRSALSRTGVKSPVVDKTVYKFLSKLGEIFIGCRYELVLKYPEIKKGIDKLFYKEPRICSLGWTLILENETEEEALLKFNKEKKVPIRRFINKSGEVFVGTYDEFCNHFQLSKVNYLRLFYAKARNTYGNWSLLKEPNGTT